MRTDNQKVHHQKQILVERTDLKNISPLTYLKVRLMVKKQLEFYQQVTVATSDGSSPFKEVYFHEVQVDGKWVKLMDPGKNPDGSPTGERSPLNEVEEALKLTGNQKIKKTRKSLDNIVLRNFTSLRLLTVTLKRMVLSFGGLNGTIKVMV
jgi:hypothetical protein